MKKNNVHIKKCVPGDINHMVKVGVQSYKEHYSYLWEDDCSDYLSKTMTKEILLEDFADHNIVFFMVEYENKPVGIVKINKDSALDNHELKSTIEIEKIYFLNEVTGKGLGKLTMEFIFKYARKLNKKVLWLDVMTTSPAYKFYQKSGFKKSGKKYFDFPLLKPQYSKMYVMKKML